MTGFHPLDTVHRDDAELDRRIGAALRAAAAQVDDETLRPALAPRAGSVPARGHLRWTAPLLAAAAVVSVIAGTVAVTSSPSGQPRRVPVGSDAAVSLGSGVPGSARTTGSTSVPASSGRTAPATDAPSAESGSSSQPSTSAHCPFADLACPQSSGFYQPLWPFADYDEVQQWQAQVATGAAATWHADAVSTARNYLHDVLGFTELDVIKAVAPSVASAEADVQVGYRDGAGAVHVAATLHLVRYGWPDEGTDAGNAAHAPWEVVGTEDDPGLTAYLAAPDAASARSLTVRGTLTGHRQQLAVTIRDRHGALLSTAPPVAAGGEGTTWSTVADYTGGGGLLVAVVSAGDGVVKHSRFVIATMDV